MNSLPTETNLLFSNEETDHGFVGLLGGATALLIPCIGWVAVAGPIATMLTGAARSAPPRAA